MENMHPRWRRMEDRYKTDHIKSKIGASGFLPCEMPPDTDKKEVSIVWQHENLDACTCINGMLCEAGRFVNRTLPGDISKNSCSLEINPVKQGDGGKYRCKVNGKVQQRIHLDVEGELKGVVESLLLSGPECRKVSPEYHLPSPSAMGNMTIDSVMEYLMYTVLFILIAMFVILLVKALMKHYWRRARRPASPEPSTSCAPPCHSSESNYVSPTATVKSN